VDLTVAILAFPLDGAAADRRAVRRRDGGTGQGIATVIEIAGMAAPEVAALAEVWLLGLEELVVVRAVGVVAGEAILTDRGVLMEKRAALFGVTLVALLVNRIGRDHLGIGPVVRIMAAYAAHLALEDGVVGRALALGPIGFVTGEAGRGFGRGPEHVLFGFRVVDAVAGGAVHSAPGVHAAEEARLAGFFMTRQTRLGFLVGRVGRLKGQNGRSAALLEMGFGAEMA
jgi:hypothetical protein